jgi:hypothetical protein
MPVQDLDDLTTIQREKLNASIFLGKEINFAARISAIHVSSTGEASIDLGDSSTALTLTAGTPLLEIYSTCSSTSGSTNAEPFYMKSTMTGAGGVGGRARFHLSTNVALGGWSNAIKGLVEYGASGRTTGLGSAICAELALSAGTSSGTYTAMELELVLATNAVTGTKTSFIYANASGAAASTFDTNGVFLHIGDGITAAATKFVSATYQTLKCYFTDSSTTRYMFLSQIEDGVGLGNSSTAQTLTAGTPMLQVYSTCSSTSGSTNAEPIYMKSTMSGAGGVGGRAKFDLYASAALGGWCNAIKGQTEFADSTGRVTGLASAVCAEMILSTGTTQGNYAPLEAELIANSAVSTGTRTAFLYCNVAGSNGTGITTINTNGYFLVIGDGIADTAGGIWEAESITATNFSHVLKCNIDGTDMWIGLHTDKDFTT